MNIDTNPAPATGRGAADREIISAVDLCTSAGLLNPAAVGWTRTPLHTANLRGWGRRKRWEYWCLVSDSHIFAMTISSLDYAGVHGIYVLERATGRETVRDAIAPLARGVVLGDRAGADAQAEVAGMRLSVTEGSDGTRLQADADGVQLDAFVARDWGEDGAQESLGVVIPWNRTHFQYTVKTVARPVRGHLRLGEERHDLSPAAFAVLDHGRGIWPYQTTWNWAAGHGAVGGRRIGLQIGCKWTDGTGTSENAVFLDGRLHRLSGRVDCTFNSGDRMDPWHLRGQKVDVCLTSFHVRESRSDLRAVSSQIYQAFGVFTGSVVTDEGEVVPVDGLTGWVEEARNRW